MIRRAVAAGILLLAAVGPAGSEEALEARGKRLFIEKGCHGCHTVGAMGTPIAPDLSQVGSRYPVAFLERWLRDPARVRPTAHMPRIDLGEGEIRALAAYLASLR
jgi:cytochrome c oxidase subunit II